jgi:hypothetical protein
MNLLIRGGRLCGYITIYAALHGQTAQATPAANESISIILDGVSMRVPVAYIPVAERGIYRSDQPSNGLRIQATLPEMTPYDVHEDNRPVFDRYKDEISILISPVRNASKESRRLFFENYENVWLRDRMKEEGRFSLNRFVLRPRARSPLGDDDVYLSPASEDDKTMIFCTSENVPDPTSAEASRARREKQLVKNPLCNQLFFLPKYGNIMIRVSYFRRNLKNWKKIQNSASNLLYSFFQREK